MLNEAHQDNYAGLTEVELSRLLNNVGEKARVWMEERTGRPERGVPDIMEWPEYLRQELHAIKLAMPLYCELRLRAKERIQERIEARKARSNNSLRAAS